MDSKIEILLENTNRYAQNGDWASAFNELEKAYQIKKDDVGIINGLGQCVLQLQNYEEAFTFFQQAVILAPDSSEVHNNLGIVHELLGQFDAAEGSFQMATTLDPENAQAWKNLASLYLKQDHRVGEGVQILQAIILSNPKDSDALYLMGNCYAEIGNLESATLLFQTALSYQPDHILAQAGLDALTEAKDQVEAAQDRIARPEHAKKLASLKGLLSKKDSITEKHSDELLSNDDENKKKLT